MHGNSEMLAIFGHVHSKLASGNMVSFFLHRRICRQTDRRTKGPTDRQTYI